MDPRTAHPARALLHPLWLAALVVLAVNDHALKGAGILPGWCTGKLSDLAGLLVAPTVLLAALGLRGHRAALGVHILTGLVFSGIQLSPELAEGWIGLTRVVGVPWSVTQDATDLIALPMLAVSYWVFARRPVRRPSSRPWLEAGAGAVGLACCMGSSPEGEGDWIPGFEAAAHLHNGTDEDVVVRVRNLSATAIVDCAVAGADPGGLLTEPVFDDVSSWTLPAGNNLPLDDGRDAPCGAAWVEVDSSLPVLVFWERDLEALPWVEGSGEGQIGAVTLRVAESGNPTFDDGGQGLLFVPRSPEQAVIGACEAQGDADRLLWTDPPVGEVTVASVTPGRDGCLRIGFAEVREPWYACIDPASFPFVVGDALRFGVRAEASNRTLTARRLPSPAEPEEVTLAEVELVFSAGDAPLQLPGVSTHVLAHSDCTPAPDLDCGTVARPVELFVDPVDGAAASVRVGEVSTVLDAEGWSNEVRLVHGQERLVFEPQCAMGPDEGVTDLEMVVVRRR